MPVISATRKYSRIFHVLCDTLRRQEIEEDVTSSKERGALGVRGTRLHPVFIADRCMKLSKGNQPCASHVIEYIDYISNELVGE